MHKHSSSLSGILRMISFSICLVTGLASASQVSATPVQSAFFSEGCGNVDYEVVKSGNSASMPMIMNESLEIAFMDFSLIQDRAGFSSSPCHMIIDITVPAGKSFRAVSASAEGTYSLMDGAEGTVNIDYDVQPLGAIGICRKSGLRGSGDLQLMAKMDKQSFTGCSKTDQTVTLSTMINPIIRSQQDGLSEIVLDQSDTSAESRKNISWAWEWTDCSLERPKVNFVDWCEVEDSDFRPTIGRMMAYVGMDVSTEEKWSSRDCKKAESKLKRLKSLSIGNYSSDVSQLRNHKQVMSNYDRITDLGPLQSLTNLETLEIDYGTDLSSIAAIGKLRKLKKLILSGTDIESISELANLSELRYLDISSNQISDGAALRNLAKLSYLNVSYNEASIMKGLVNPRSLKHLEMRDINATTQDFALLGSKSHFPKLETINISNNPGITCVSPLRRFLRLKEIKAYGNKIETYRTLKHIPFARGIEHIYTDYTPRDRTCPASYCSF